MERCLELAKAYEKNDTDTWNLKADGSGLKVSLYEPEIMSKFLSLRGTGALYKSSFARQPVRTGLWE